MLHQIANSLERISIVKLTVALVIYAVSVAMIFQLIVLPYMLTELHAGNGLLVNGDWVNFHKIAFEKYEEIITHGWSVWELRPRGQFPSGIASIFYVLIYPEPWSLIPLNAVVWALSGITIIHILQIFISNRGYAILASIPFMFFPSAAMWYTQILKDGFYTLGLLLLLYSCIRIVRLSLSQGTLKNIAWNTTIIAISIVLIWSVRPYSIYFALALIVIATLVVLVGIIRHIQLRVPVTKNNYASLASMFFALVIAGNVSSLDTSNKRISIYNESLVASDNYERNDSEKYIQSNWDKSKWMPDYVERKFLTLSVIRAKYININPEAGSNIKGDEYLFSADDIIQFTPRAIVIAYAAPTPFDWARRLSDGSASIFYKISIIEMMVVYIGLVFFIAALWMWRAKWEIWLISAFTGVFLSVHGIVIPNIGTLYRMRYGMLMLIVTIGLAALVKIIHDRKYPTEPF